MIDVAVVKGAVPLLDVIGMDVDLRRAGGGWYEGPCPWCGGTDRFQVRTVDGPGGKAGWFCRKCAPVGGDVINYIERRDGVDFREALAILANRHGLPDLSPDELTRRRADMAERRQAAEASYAKAREEAAGALQRVWTERDLARRLAAQQAVLDQLAREGVDADAVTFFSMGFGYVPVDGVEYPALSLPWGRTGEDGKLALRALQFRLLVPEAPGGRYRWAVGSQAKGAVFNEDAVLAPQGSTLVVVEGAKKAAALWSAGETSVCAITNRTGWPGAIAREEIKHAVGQFDRVVFALDPDAYADGVEAARTIPNGRVARLPMKPDDLLVATGGDMDLLQTFVATARVP